MSLADSLIVYRLKTWHLWIRAQSGSSRISIRNPRHSCSSRCYQNATLDRGKSSPFFLLNLKTKPIQAPEKLKNVKTDEGDEWATPEEVALAMLDLVEKDECVAGKIEGGSILEVGKDQVRLVTERNDPGPSGPGHSVTGNARAAEEAFENLREEGWGKSKL